MSRISGPPYTHTLARVNARFPSEPLAHETAAELEHAGLRSTPPLWEGCILSRPWLLQVTCPRDLSDGVDPVEAVRLLIQRSVHIHDGVLLDDVPEHIVVPGISHSMGLGGAPFVGHLPKQVIKQYERGLHGRVGTENDEPLPGLGPHPALRTLIYLAPTPATTPYEPDALDLCHARADQRGWTVVGVHTDDYTGTAWHRMRADLDAGNAEALVVLSPRTIDRVPPELLVGLADHFGLAVSVVYWGRADQ